MKRTLKITLWIIFVIGSIAVADYTLDPSQNSWSILQAYLTDIDDRLDDVESGGAGPGVPDDVELITYVLSDDLNEERVLTAGDGVAVTSPTPSVISVAVDSTVIRTTGNQSVGGTKTFTDIPICTATPSQDYHLSNKEYVDSVAAGIPVNGPYITFDTDATLTQERVINGDDGITITSPTPGTIDIDVDSTVVRTSGAQSVGGAKTFTDVPICTSTPSAGYHLVNKTYLDSIASAAAPRAATYITQSASETLTAERVLTGGSGIDLTDGGVNSTMTVAVDSTVVRTTGNQSVAGTKTFSDVPACGTPPSSGSQLTNKDYVDSVAGDAPDGRQIHRARLRCHVISREENNRR